MKRFWKAYWIEISFFVVGCILIHLFLWDRNLRPRFASHLDTTKASELGQFIGGYLGTILLLASVALLIGSFRSQRATGERTAFESRFFELLKFHRENVSEIAIGDRVGRKVFIPLIREFRETLGIVRHCCEQLAPTYPQDRRVDLAYMVFYYGVGSNSTPVLRAAIRNDHPAQLIGCVIESMEQTQTAYRSTVSELKAVPRHNEFVTALRERLSTLTSLPYTPFDGHQSRLGHYYRHLFHLVRYAKTNVPKGLSATDYVDLVRAQLTNHEQALLCVNALSRIGARWRSEQYITVFDLIKNIPENFFDPLFEVNVRVLFKDVRFEYMTPGKGEEPNRDSM